MSKTARLVLRIVGSSLALAAFVCLLIAGWHDLSVACGGMSRRWRQKFGSDEFDDYEDEEIFQ